MNEDEKMSKDAFKALAKDLLPIFDQMNDVLEKHGVKGLSSVNLDTDGYFRFDSCFTKWEFVRSAGSDTPRIKLFVIEDV